ncbi:coiled-coil domain-containing protein 55-domain containing protein [Irpex rosettiformis]|uniref:Coiled-coil domain-containing protein 55-domain containing protein n=1 Tax=Irpex rosettiformis TaxID=378272 RepID=A0ACB8UJM4_9APHY|nr:coiled-coil domain-containing protein 55-domain containing protein [Irpex rosettiformis]
MKVSFSLKSKATAPSSSKPLGDAPSLKKPVAFASLEDDEPVDAAATAASGSSTKISANKQLIAQNVGMSKALKRQIEEEKKVDATVFEYDEVWDKMQEAKARQKVVKEADSKERKPKYINGLLTSAATRRLDHLRAEEKMIQRERETEGDEFKDKEAFVTQAYKDQMVELRRAEEEEKNREEEERKKNRGMGTGMAHFYKKLLEESEQQHEETVAATTTKPVIGPQGPAPNLTIVKPPEYTPKSDAELARIAREQGKDVELNDDNQIVDKRDLLSAGLNLSAPNTRKLGLQKAKQMGTAEESPAAHRAIGTAASRKEINARRAREVERQMEDERERILEERRRQEEENLHRVVAKRNTEESVQSAKERYLARKRRKLEEAETVPADVDSS